MSQGRARGTWQATDGNWYPVPLDTPNTDYSGEPVDEAVLRVLRSMNAHLRVVRSHLFFVAAVAVIQLVALGLWLAGVIEIGLKQSSRF